MAFGLGLGTAALIGGGLSAIGGVAGSAISADAITNAADLAAQTQENQLAFTKASLAPYQGVGAGGLSALTSLEGTPFGGYSANGVNLPGTTGGQSSDIFFNGTGLPTQTGPMPTNLPSAFGPANIGTSGIGAGGYPTALTPAINNFAGSPDYKFALQQGELANNQSLAATGQFGGGGAVRGGIQFGEGLASTDYNQFIQNILGANAQQNQEYNQGFSNAYNANSAQQTNYQNYFNDLYNQFQAGQTNFSNYFGRLSSLAGIGQAATTTGATIGQTAATNIGQAQIGAGQAQGAAAVGAANSVTGGVNSALLFSALPNYTQLAAAQQANSAGLGDAIPGSTAGGPGTFTAPGGTVQELPSSSNFS